MNDVKGILEVLCRNAEIAEKFFAIETSILSIHNFRDLFEKLLTEIHDKFSVPRVWIAMTENNDVWRLLDRMTPGGTSGIGSASSTGRSSRRSSATARRPSW